MFECIEQTTINLIAHLAWFHSNEGIDICIMALQYIEHNLQKSYKKKSDIVAEIVRFL